MISTSRILFGDHREPTVELTEIFGPAADQGTAVDRAVRWGEGVLSDASIPSTSEVAAIAALRKAEPRLGLKSATYLAGLLKG